MNHTENDFKGRWIKTLNKTYHPVSSWVIEFHSKVDIKKDNFKIETICKNQIEEYFNKQGDAIWLVDNNGKKIPALSQTGAEQEKKTLRAVFSGHELKILTVKNKNNTHFIKVGAKNIFFSVKKFFKIRWV